MSTPISNEADLAAAARLVASPATVESTPIKDNVSDEAKIAFLAHVLTGAAFLQKYDIANIGFIEFATIPATELTAIRRLTVLEEGSDPAADKFNRPARVKMLMTLACVNKIELDGRQIMPILNRKWESTEVCKDFINSLPAGVLSIIESYYADFSQLLSTLINKAPDRSFWPTL